MKLYFVFVGIAFSCLIIKKIQAQEWSLPEEINLIIMKPSGAALTEKIKLLESVDTSNLMDKERWVYNLTKSSVLLYSEKDSSLHYFWKAQHYDPRANCRVMRSIYKMQQNNEWVFENGETCFLVDLPDFDHVAYLENCNINYPIEEVERTSPISELEALLMSNDQSERQKDSIDWKVQNALDSINRSILDSLYEKHGSLQPFNKYEQDAFSFVLHHSNNCDWNYKWFVIWLEEKKKGNQLGGNVLGPAFSRMLQRNEGICYKLDPKRCEAFRSMLSDKYKEYESYWKK